MSNPRHAHVSFWVMIGLAVFVGIVSVNTTWNRSSDPVVPTTGENNPYLPDLPSVGTLPTDRPKVLESDLTIGSEQAAVTLVEFGDYTCVACGLAVPVVNEVLEKFGNRVRYVWKDYVNQSEGSRSHRIGESVRCADEQGRFWEMNNLLLQNQPAYSDEDLYSAAVKIGLEQQSFAQCLESKRYQAYVANGKAEGNALNIDATPYFFVNHQRLSGVPTVEQLSGLIEEEIKRSSAR